jgi:TolB-like protein
LLLSSIGYVTWNRSRGAAATPASIRLAVLPFQNLTGDPKREYLADGLTDEVITRLTQLYSPRLGVTARTSVMAYKSGTTRLDQIGRELGVQYALESSIRGSADGVHIGVGLIRVSDQSHLWAREFSASQNGEDVVDAVADAAARLIPLSRASPARPRPTNPVAFEAYLRARWFYSHPSEKQELDSALKYFEEAIRRDSGFAVAWVWLADARRRQMDQGRISAEDGTRLADQAIERAVALEPDLAEVQGMLAWIRIAVDWNVSGADVAFKRAIELGSTSPQVSVKMAEMAAALGHVDVALKLGRQTAEIDPLNWEPSTTMRIECRMPRRAWKGRYR